MLPNNQKDKEKPSHRRRFRTPPTTPEPEPKPERRIVCQEDIYNVYRPIRSPPRYIKRTIFGREANPIYLPMPPEFHIVDSCTPDVKGAKSRVMEGIQLDHSEDADVEPPGITDSIVALGKTLQKLTDELEKSMEGVKPGQTHFKRRRRETAKDNPVWPTCRCTPEKVGKCCRCDIPPSSEVDLTELEHITNIREPFLRADQEARLAPQPHIGEPGIPRKARSGVCVDQLPFDDTRLKADHRQAKPTQNSKGPIQKLRTDGSPSSSKCLPNVQPKPSNSLDTSGKSSRDYRSTTESGAEKSVMESYEEGKHDFVKLSRKPDYVRYNEDQSYWLYRSGREADADTLEEVPGKNWPQGFPAELNHQLRCNMVSGLPVDSSQPLSIRSKCYVKPVQQKVSEEKRESHRTIKLPLEKKVKILSPKAMLPGCYFYPVVESVPVTLQTPKPANLTKNVDAKTEPQKKVIDHELPWKEKIFVSDYDQSNIANYRPACGRTYRRKNQEHEAPERTIWSRASSLDSLEDPRRVYERLQRPYSGAHEWSHGPEKPEYPSVTEPMVNEPMVNEPMVNEPMVNEPCKKLSTLVKPEGKTKLSGSRKISPIPKKDCPAIRCGAIIRRKLVPIPENDELKDAVETTEVVESDMRDSNPIPLAHIPLPPTPLPPTSLPPDPLAGPFPVTIDDTCGVDDENRIPKKKFERPDRHMPPMFQSFLEKELMKGCLVTSDKMVNTYGRAETLRLKVTSKRIEMEMKELAEELEMRYGPTEGAPSSNHVEHIGTPMPPPNSPAGMNTAAELTRPVSMAEILPSPEALNNTDTEIPREPECKDRFRQQGGESFLRTQSDPDIITLYLTNQMNPPAPSELSRGSSNPILDVGTPSPNPSSPKPPSPKPPIHKPPIPKPSSSKPPSPKPPIPKPPIHKPPISKPSIPKPSIHKPSIHKPSSPKPPISKPSSPKPPISKPPISKPSSPKPPISKPLIPKPSSPKPPGLNLPPPLLYVGIHYPGRLPWSFPSSLVPDIHSESVSSEEPSGEDTGSENSSTPTSVCHERPPRQTHDRKFSSNSIFLMPDSANRNKQDVEIQEGKSYKKEQSQKGTPDEKEKSQEGTPGKRRKSLEDQVQEEKWWNSFGRLFRKKK